MKVTMARPGQGQIMPMKAASHEQKDLIFRFESVGEMDAEPPNTVGIYFGPFRVAVTITNCAFVPIINVVVVVDSEFGRRAMRIINAN